MALKFVDEVPRSTHATRNNKYVGILIELIQNPGKWACIIEYKGSGSAYSMPRRLRELPGWGDGNVEFAARKRPSGSGSVLYARYVGPTLPAALTGISESDGNGGVLVSIPAKAEFEELGPNQS